MDILVVGIAGGSGCGKTTLVDELKRRFGDRVSVISHDSYYKAHHDMTYDERCLINYDEPAAFESDMLEEHLRELKQGRSVQVPIYDYTIHDRGEGFTEVFPSPVIIVEGILIFENRRLSDLFDIKVYVDADADVRLTRRIRRDVVDRGRTVDSVINQYLNTVKPMHEAYVEPSKKNANIIVPEGGKNMVALEMLFLRIKHHIDGCINGQCE